MKIRCSSQKTQILNNKIYENVIRIPGDSIIQPITTKNNLPNSIFNRNQEKCSAGSRKSSPSKSIIVDEDQDFCKNAFLSRFGDGENKKSAINCDTVKKSWNSFEPKDKINHVNIGSFNHIVGKSDVDHKQTSDLTCFNNSYRPLASRGSSTSIWSRNKLAQTVNKSEFVDPPIYKKVISLTEATDSRPPLKIDMDTPGPTCYTPRLNPSQQTTSPSWSFGRRSYVEKDGGSKTSWAKTWFQTNDVWRNKTDFRSDTHWPSPADSGNNAHLLGRSLVSMKNSPAFTMGFRKEESSPNISDSINAEVLSAPEDNYQPVVANSSPSFTHGVRRGGTMVSLSTGDITPAPNTYRPKIEITKLHRPSYSIPSRKLLERNDSFGPFAVF